MTLEEKFWQLYMIPGDLDDPSHDYGNGVFGLQISTVKRQQNGGSAEVSPSEAARMHAERINAIQRFFVEKTRLGVPIIPFEEALHGLSQPGATIFPQAIGLAATWDTSLMSRVAGAIARETRTRGVRQVPNWSTVDPAVVQFPGATGPAITVALQHGDPAGTVWRPAEADTSIRPGWFYHPAEDDRVRSVDSLVDLYFQSVGRNSKLLLNVPPTPEGVLHDVDARRLLGCRDRLAAMFGTDLAAGLSRTWRRTGERTAIAELDLGRSATVAVARLEEDVTKGQMVASYTLSGSEGASWRVLSKAGRLGTPASTGSSRQRCDGCA